MHKIYKCSENHSLLLRVETLSNLYCNRTAIWSLLRWVQPTDIPEKQKLSLAVMALEILSLQTNIMQYSSHNERETVIRETLYWVGLKYVLQTLDAIRYLCQQLQDILEDMEGYWKLIMVFLWQVDLVFPYPTQHFRHLNSIMYSLCVIQDFYLIAWDQTAPCHSDIIDTDNNYKNEFKNVFLKCTCVHNCAAVFTFSQSEVVGAVCLLPPLLSKKKKLQTGSESYRLQRPT